MNGFEKYSINTNKQDIAKAKELEGEILLEEMPVIEDYEKTEKEIEIINKASKIVSKTLSYFGVENDFYVDPSLVLIAKDGKLETKQINDTEKRKTQLHDGQAFHKTIGGNIIIAESLLYDEHALLHALIHEFFHSAGTNYGFLTKENEDFDARLIQKSGYMTKYNSQNENKVLFRGFNEAITEELAREAAKMYFDESFHDEGLEEMLLEWDEVYQIERTILYSIILKISDEDDKKINETWKDFIKGYTNGTKMHLREIEKHYGKDSLKILSMLGSFGTDVDLQILNYFLETDDEKRKSIKNSILIKNSGV